MTQPLLNYHYRSKDELWRAAVDSLFESARAVDERSLAEELRDADELTGAKLLVREFITFSARNPQLHRLITQECKADSARMDYLVERHVRPLYDRTVALFERSPATVPYRPSRPRTSTTSSPAPVRRCSCSRRSAVGSAASTPSRTT